VSFNRETTMAGELIRKVKESEQKASQIISDVKDKAMKMILSAEEKKSDFLKQKDALLKDDEKRIKEQYEREKQQMILEIENEEKGEIRSINTRCEKNLLKVVRFITKEIVKE
jgi:vacuolar-type H+-ATPase subunit H